MSEINVFGIIYFWLGYFDVNVFIVFFKVLFNVNIEWKFFFICVVEYIKDDIKI